MHRNLKTARPQARLVQGKTDWYRIENKADAGATVYIYDEIGYFGTTADDFVRDLSNVETDHINLRINSPGGDVFDGIAILNSLRGHKASVTTYIDGLAASAASFIAMAGDEIVMGRNSEMMIHDAFGICIGNAADMRDLADRMDKVSDNIASIYAERTGGTTSDWRAYMVAETWYSAHEAVDAGLATRVDGVGKDDSAKDRYDLSIFAYAGRKEAPEPAPVPKTPAFAWDPDMFREAVKEASK